MKHESLFILGRQPAIGRAELESLLGTKHVEPVGDSAMASDLAPDTVPFDRIGSSIRLAKPLTMIPTTKWPQITRAAAEQLTELLDYLPAEGKLKLGLSSYGLPVTAGHLFQAGLEFKKVCKAQNRSVRIVPSTDLTLNSAQVLYNKLTKELGIELLFIKCDGQTYLAQTIAIQDIDAYARRDQGRPKRNSFVGMLPPKLAQTIVNLATGPLEPNPENTILDPFCGTGVILQEASLMDYSAYGTDLEKRMIDYTRTNLEWLSTHGVNATPILEVGDATSHQWQHPFSVVASETYLGHPLTNWPRPEKLREIIGTCNVIIQKFLANITTQIPAGTRLCLAVPAWQSPSGHITHLPVLDQIEVLGYNRVSFSWANGQNMIYRRPEQLVARELLVITRK